MDVRILGLRELLERRRGTDLSLANFTGLLGAVLRRLASVVSTLPTKIGERKVSSSRWGPR